MTNINIFDIFKNSTSTIRQISKDDSNNEYMTDCNLMAINFDKVSKKYCKNLSLFSVESNDALFALKNGKCTTFIEFKNGYIDKTTQYKLVKKIYDSMLVFMDVTKTNISETRDFLNYILVYNENKNADNPKTEYHESESRDFIDKTILEYGKEVHIKYGLDFFKGYCFKEVNTYTKKEFENLFVSKLLI